MSKLQGRRPHTTIVDDMLDDRLGGDLHAIHIDQLGRVVQREHIKDGFYGDVRRCVDCVYYSKVYKAMRHDPPCKFNNYGPIEEAKACFGRVWKEVKDE